MAIAAYRFDGCQVIVNTAEQYLETRFPDGTCVPAAPNHDDDSVMRAYELGYNCADDRLSCWLMTRDHELSHTWLAHLRHEGFSHVLRLVAHGGDLDQNWVRAEEARVLRFQRQLPKALSRPWDVAAVPGSTHVWLPEWPDLPVKWPT